MSTLAGATRVRLRNGRTALLLRPSPPPPTTQRTDQALAALREQVAAQAALAASLALQVFPEWQRHFNGQRVQPVVPLPMSDRWP